MRGLTSTEHDVLYRVLHNSGVCGASIGSPPNGDEVTACQALRANGRITATPCSCGRHWTPVITGAGAEAMRIYEAMRSEVVA